jgi:hypothetical protein
VLLAQKKRVSDNEFIDIYNKLKLNGGVCAINNGEVEPDILTTYQFMVSLGRMNNYDNLNAQKEFIEALKMRDRLYKKDINSDDIYELSVITYANVIRHLEAGEDKDGSITVKRSKTA